MYIVIYIHIYNHTYNYILYMYIKSFHFSHKQLSMPFLLPPNIISPVSLLPLMPIKLLSSSQGRQAGGATRSTWHLAREIYRKPWFLPLRSWGFLQNFP